MRPSSARTLFLALALAWPGAAFADPPAAPASRVVGTPAAPASPRPAASPARPAEPAAPIAARSRASLPAPAGLTWRRYEAHEVQLRNIAAVVRVIPEARADVSLAIVNDGPLAAPDLRMGGETLILDGGLGRRIHECRERDNGFQVQVARHGWVNEAQLPMVYLRVPENVEFGAGGAVSLWMTDAETAHVSLGGCGAADFEKIRGAAEISLGGGEMNLRVYEARSAEIALAGAGDLKIGHIRDGLTLSIAGGGDVDALRVDGAIEVAIQGAGDITIRDGRATNMSVAVMGAGDVNFGGEARDLDVAIFGAGDVRVRRVTGNVSRRVFGPGEVTVGR